MSSNILNSLNEAQKNTLEQCRIKWEKNMLATKTPLPSKEFLMEQLSALYKLDSRAAPKHVLVAKSISDGLDMISFLLEKFNSGVDVAEYVSDIKDANPEQTIRDRRKAEGKDLKKYRDSERTYPTYMTYDSYWLYWFDFLLDNPKLMIEAKLSTEEIKNIEGLRPMLNLAANGAGWTWMYPDIAFVCPVASEMHVKIQPDRYVLHNPDGPAVVFEDGTKVYMVNNVAFTGDMIRFVDTPAKDLDPKEILNIVNVEQRQEMIRKKGVTNMFKELEPKLLDSWSDKLGNPYKLYEIDFGMRPNRKYIQMQNPSVAEEHYEAVHPDCKTCEEALAWRTYGDTKTTYHTPLALT